MPHHIAARTSPEISAAKLIVDREKKKTLDAGLFVPPDPEEANDRYAVLAQCAVDAYRRASGSEPDTALPDLLGDLMHLAARREIEIGWNFEAALNRARLDYREETTEEKSNGAG